MSGDNSLSFAIASVIDTLVTVVLAINALQAFSRRRFGHG